MTAPVLFEDADLVVVAKAPGVVVIPARHAEPLPSLRESLQAARGEPLWVLHRIDRDTSGVVAFARNAEAHRTLSMDFEHRRVEKTYVALCRGALSPRAGRIEVALHPARKGKMRPALPGEAGSLEARTDYEVTRAWRVGAGVVSLIQATPRTGRQHQIRVHLRAREAPLLVDPLYGRAARFDGPAEGVDASLERLSLHAAALAFTHPRTGARMEVRCPLADDLAAVVDALDRGAARVE